MRVTDAGIAHIGGLTSLRLLWLERTRVTDVGLAHLGGLINLQDLDLRRTRVTYAGVAELKKRLPETRIEWW